MFSNRECFWGRNYIPVDYFNKAHCWPPTYVKCDCSELAKHKTYMKNGHFYGLAENTRDFNHGMNRIQL